MNFKSEPLISEEKLQTRLDELAAQINKDFGDHPLTVICVLKGAFIFAADLVRRLKMPVHIEFIGVSSYAGTESTGHVRITHDLSADIVGKNVLLVEDIIDTGRTIDYLIDAFRVRAPKSVKVCTLLSKPEVHDMRNKLDYVGFDISKEFVVGYGLDLDGLYRNLPHIAQLES